MAKTDYLTSPPKISTMPPGVPYIVGNEAAERFSYYGMNSILTIFMTKYLLDKMGHLSAMSAPQAEAWYHTFVSVLYILPIFGAVLADAVFGKFWVVFWISIVYCAGHAVLALMGSSVAHMIEPRYLLAIGLSLIAIGAGGIKPCVSTNVGDQFGASNQHLLTRVFNWFYFSINAGSFISTLLIPWLLEPYTADPAGMIAKLPPGVVSFLESPRLHSPDVAFGLPGVFMAMATLVFWLGRRKFVHIPPVGLRNYAREIFNRETGKTILNVLMPVPFVMIFWALWQQNFSSWIVQAESMDRHLFGIEWLSSQIQTVNPIFILILLPVFSYWLYPFLEKFVRLTPLRKIGAGLFVTAGSFFIVALIQTRIDAGARPSIIWQVWAFVVLTAGETLVSPTHLEFSYTQGPVKLKSLIMCTYLLAVSLGNQFTAAVNFFIQNPDGTVKLQGASYFMFFVWVMLGTAVLFAIVSPFYKGRTYLQDQSAVTGDAEPAVGFAVQPEA
ncbi:MAG TPA: POT family MFS transporter [Chthoniobacterales bacterium]|jgi:POT family proton-dependent oligopeptide transporter